MKNKTLLTLFHLSLGLLAGAPFAGAQTPTTFSYQGKLDDGGRPATGLYDFGSRVFASLSANDPVSFPTNLVAVPVTNGVFTVYLDFGSAPFNGDPRWMEISVKSNTSPALPTFLRPRTLLTPTPYAIYAQKAGSVTSGAIGMGQLANAAVCSNQLANYCITAQKIAAGQVVKSLNGLKDDVMLTSDGTITVTPNPSGNTIQLSTTGSGVFSLNGTSAYYTGGNVGIGTSNPSTPLDVLEGGLHTKLHGNGVTFSRNNGPAYIWAENAGGRIDFVTDGRVPSDTTANLVLNTDQSSYFNGNVGIGKSAPTYALDVNGGVNANELQVTDGSTPKVNFFSRWRHWFQLRAEGQYPNSMFSIIDSTFGDTPWYRLSILGNGNVGIGTTDPGFRLDVNGRIRLRQGSDASAGVWLQSPHSFGSGGVADIAFVGVMDPTRIGFWGNDPRGALGWGFSFDTVTGNVGIGTGNSYPTDKLHVNGSVRVGCLTITGGCDLAEPFQMSEEEISEGSVVIIDEENPGHLKQATRSYDTRVAGIVSGANGIKAGIALHQEGAIEGGQNVALTGRVYVKADASLGAIKPGDLLTTSDTPGHAMKVIDSTKAQGAILGKAMTALAEGTGMVLVLVSLQ